MTRVQRWEKRAEIPLLLLALAFLVAYAWPVLDPRLSPDLRTTLEVASWTVWAAFIADFAARLFLADDRREYALSHWYDVALILLPMLRPLRLLRLLAFARVLNRSAAGSLVGRVSTYVAGTAAMALGLGALAILDAEQDAAGANIRTFGDALWWSATTVTTVGYGDHFPVTTTGRLRRGRPDGRGHRVHRCDHGRGGGVARRPGRGRGAGGRRPSHVANEDDRREMSGAIFPSASYCREMDDGPFFHGTKADLKVGDLLTAGRRSNYRPEIVMNHVYFTALRDPAGLAAELAAGDGEPRVYQVEPLGDFEDDPNVTDKKFPGNPTRSYRSTEPLRVVAEVADWPRLSPEALQAWRDRVAQMARDEAEIVN